MAKFTEIPWQLLAMWKWLASFFKNNWTLKDYPIRFVYRAPDDPHSSGRFKPLCWQAQIVNRKGMGGYGITKMEALDSLRKIFERFQARTPRPEWPRPGSKFEELVTFAVAAKIDQHRLLANEFTQKVLELPWAWISDVSSLWDFHGAETNQKYHERIRELYGVDVSDITNGNLADIFDRISTRSSKPPIK
ncbi:MAG TPA: hypothetical protein VGD60_03100 [Candidatus Acidoferrales bacterium]